MNKKIAMNQNALSLDTDTISGVIPRIQSIKRTRVNSSLPFTEIAAKFAYRKGTVLLLSGTELDCAGYDILAAEPWLTVSAKERKIELAVNGETFSFEGDPLEAVDIIISLCSIEMRPEFSPVTAGLFGYLSYDLKDAIESLPNTCMDQNLPDLYLSAPSTVLVRNRADGTIDHIAIETNSGDSGLESGSGSYFSDILRSISPTSNSEKGACEIASNGIGFSIDPSGFVSNFTKAEYVDAVSQVIEYIKAGDIYQANLSQRFSVGFEGDPFSLFLKLFEKNPAPFFSYINAGDHHVISTSPERFIKRDGSFVETRPIKGTLPRGKSEEEDRALGEALLASRKDEAELSMIVDLMRNDLGKVSRGGTVKVTEHKRLEPYDNVFHLVSIVEAELDPGKSSVDLIRATFPGGSITGCPKIRSMEIIDELESVRRHVYTGSIGYISFHDTLDLSIAIRTAVVAGGKIGFSVGGGIVFDSDPENEYEETLHKGRTLLDTLISSSSLKQGSEIEHSCTPGSEKERGPDNNSDNTQNNSPEKISGKVSDKISKKRLESLSSSIGSAKSAGKKAWVNGKIVDEISAAVPYSYTGFQYGAGLFETILVEQGRILRLDDHISRLASSWQTLFDENIVAITWKDVIDRVVRLNGLESESAAVKIVVARGARGAEDDMVLPAVDGRSDFAAVFARPYTHRLVLKSRSGKDKSKDKGKDKSDEAAENSSLFSSSGLDLVTFPEYRETPLAAHKSLNYLYYHLAGLHAKKSGMDEALICNCDGTVSETNSGSIIAVSKGEKKLFVPESTWSLPGVTLKAVEKIFVESGYEIVRAKITPSELSSLENVIVLNSLMGAVRVLSIDGIEVRHTYEELCYCLNSKLLQHK